MNIYKIWDVLEGIPDPEIPNISIVEMGIVRKLKFNDGILNVTITPTYSGCPAMSVIKSEIKKHLIKEGVNDFEINTSLFPPWTTGWLSEKTKSKLQSIGIAPPKKQIECPYCNSNKIQLVSEFGSTLCKSYHKCIHCMEIFENFKCI
tara:strand:- start:1012 stop:1455 length:444 start_codon:yes stop_codon:yes gene_type:complete